MSSLFQRLTGLSLLDPGLLALALLVPAALLLRRRRDPPAIPLAPVTLFASGDPLPRSWRVSLLPLPRVLAAIGLLLVVVALARPASREALPVRSEGIDILLCLDTSSSMTSNDMDRQRTRLEVARDAASRFIEGRPHDRIGLVAFARYPDVRCPLTLDHEALKTILTDVTTVASDGAEDATGIGTAVARAAQVLAGAGGRSRVVILLTDGEENVALAGTPGEIPPVQAAQLCEQLGVRVYAIAAGVGRPDASGRIVKLDTAPIERLAARTGGAFHEAQDAGAMTAVYGKIDALEKAAIEEPRFVYEDRYLAFLFAALGLLLGGALLSSTVFGVLP